MLLSKQQQYILETLRRLGCVRERQLEELLRARFFPEGRPVPPGFLDALLRQLRCCNMDVCREDGVVFLPGRTPDPRLLEAVDVMLELSGAAPADFWTGDAPPVLLRFSVADRRISLFAVLHSAGVEGPHVRAPPAVGKTERVVVLLPDGGVPPALNIPNTVFYALRQKDGSHRFFAREQNQ